MVKRRKKIIDGKFQLGFSLRVISVALLGFLFIMAVAGINATRNGRQLQASIAGLDRALPAAGRAEAGDHGVVEALKGQASLSRELADRNFLLITVILATVLAQCIILYFYLIRLTHRVAGPLYVISRYMDEIMEGRHPEFRALRERDEFKEFHAKFIRMAESLEREHHEES